MCNSFKNLKNKEKGQGLVEYSLIIVLVSIVVIAAAMILGPQIGNIFSKVNSSLSVAGSGGGSVVVAPTEAPTQLPACSSTPAFEAWKTSMNNQCNARPGVGKFVQFSCNATTNTTSATCFAASSVGQTPIPYNQGSFAH